MHLLKGPSTVDKAVEIGSLAIGRFQWLPAWDVPTIDEIRCKVLHDCSPVPNGGGGGKARAKELEEDLDPDGPPGWPLGIKTGEKSRFYADDVAEIVKRLPQYKIKGPGLRAVCYGQGGLWGSKSRLITVKTPVFSVDQAAKLCDGMEECTHFTVMVGPDYPSGPSTKGIPYRAEFCKGGKVSVVPFQGTHSFVGIKKDMGREVPYPPPETNDDRLPGIQDGPIFSRSDYLRLANAKLASNGADEEVEKAEAENRKLEAELGKEIEDLKKLQSGSGTKAAGLPLSLSRAELQPCCGRPLSEAPEVAKTARRRGAAFL